MVFSRPGGLPFLQASLMSCVALRFVVSCDCQLFARQIRCLHKCTTTYAI